MRAARLVVRYERYAETFLECSTEAAVILLRHLRDA
jgi:hypothetical protein